MPTPPHIIVLGTGAGGYVAAIRAAQLGARVTVVERDRIGGVCLNRGCIPSKALVASVNVLQKIRQAEDFGILIPGKVSVDMGRMVARKNRIVGEQVGAIVRFFGTLGIRTLMGAGRLTGPRSMDILEPDGSTVSIEGDRIILATGSRPMELSVLPFDRKTVISTDDALDLAEIPRRIAIIGGGVSGCEFSFIFGGLGSHVTLIESADRVLLQEDGEISELLEREMARGGIDLIAGATVTDVDVTSSGIRLILDGRDPVTVDTVLVTVGRILNTAGLGLETCDIDTGPGGMVRVNPRMETAVSGIFAVGDMTGGWMLAHVAALEGRIAAEAAMGLPSEMDYSVIPAGIFTIPEIGRVGLTEEAALDQGLEIKVSRFQFRALGKAHAIGETEGMVKLISHAKTDKILGVHILGPHATDIIHEAALAMQLGGTVEAVARTVHAHPTLAEGIMEAAIRASQDRTS